MNADDILRYKTIKITTLKSAGTKNALTTSIPNVHIAQTLINKANLYSI